MTGQLSPDWYDDGSGRERWWNGSAWTASTRPMARAGATQLRDGGIRPRQVPHAGTARTHGAASAAARPWSLTSAVSAATARARGAAPEGATAPSAPPVLFRGRTLLLVAGAAAVLGLFAGGLLASSEDPDVTHVPAYAAMKARADGLNVDRDRYRTDAGKARAALSRAVHAPGAKALADRAKALDARETDLDERESKLEKREQKVSTAADDALNGDGAGSR